MAQDSRRDEPDASEDETREQDSAPGGSRGDGDTGSGPQEKDASGLSAPSIGPNTKIEREDPEDRLARHEQSEVDAMGLDKRREVTGRSYGPSKARQATLYGIALAVIALLVVGGIFATNQLDKPPENQQDEAPWSGPDADQRPVQPLQ